MMRRSGRVNGMVFGLKRSAVLGLGLLALACDDDGGGGSTADAQADAGILIDMGEGGAGGAGGQGGEGGQGGAGGEGGMGGAGGAGGMGGAGGGPGLRDIETCPEICAVYEEECGRLGDLWGGSFDACQTACEEGRTNERFPSYLACMQITACADLQTCVVPQRPLPPCADVCTAADACEDDYRLPSGFSQFADCTAACADGTAARQIASCGVDLVDNATCDEPAFARCLLEQRDRTCLEVCDARQGCDDTIDAIDCAIACSQPIDDALVALKAEALRTCVRQAADCEALAACEATAPSTLNGVPELCAADLAGDCQFFPADTCEADASRALRGRGDAGVACMVAGTEACADPVFACFASPAAPEDGCSNLCRYTDICGQLPAGATEFDCLETCRDALAGEGAPGEADRVRGEFVCLRAESCAELADCRATASPASRCEAHCAIVNGCEAPDANCAAHCTAHFNTRRMQAELDCTAAAEGCDAAARCATPEPPPCDLRCDALVECGANAAACAAACDDDHFANPTGFIEQVACVNASARCSARAACADDASRGDACRGWCDLQVGCEGGDEAALLDCVVACAREGVPGRDGLTFAAAETCLAQNVGGECAALGACVNVQPDAFCERFCAEQDRCGVASDDCLATCTEDPDAVVDDAVCVLNAQRREAGCADVAVCVGYLPDPPATTDCVDLCAAQNRCDENLDRFLCERQCSPPGDALAVQAACARRADCAQLSAVCLAADGTIPPTCGEACNTTAACADLVGAAEGALYADTLACGNDCAAGALLVGASYADNIVACVGDAACAAEDVASCFENPKDDCAATLEVINICGFGPIVANDPAQYLVDCANNLATDPVGTQTTIDCILDLGASFNGVPPADPLACFGLLACAGF